MIEVYCEFETILDSVSDNLGYRNPFSKTTTNTKKKINFEKKYSIYNMYR